MLSTTTRVGLRAFSALKVPVRNAPLRSQLEIFNPVIQTRQWSAMPISARICTQLSENTFPRTLTVLQQSSTRILSTARIVRQEATAAKDSKTVPSESLEESSLEFKPTLKGEAAKAVDLSARLKDRSPQGEKGETLRLLKLAAREWRMLTGNLFQLISTNLVQWLFSCYVSPQQYPCQFPSQ